MEADYLLDIVQELREVNVQLRTLTSEVRAQRELDEKWLNRLEALYQSLQSRVRP